MEDVLLTPCQAAKLLDVSTRTLINWEESGIITAHLTPGGHRRYSQSDIDSMLKRRIRRLEPKFENNPLLELDRVTECVSNRYVARLKKTCGVSGRRFISAECLIPSEIVEHLLRGGQYAYDEPDISKEPLYVAPEDSPDGEWE